MSVAFIPSSIESQPHPWPVRRFTLAEYRQMCEAGIIPEDERVEFLDGWIVPQMTHNPPHDAGVQLCQAAIGAVLGNDWTLRIQSAVCAGESEPEPDLAVVRMPVRRYADHHPQPLEVGLLIEVAETALARDRAKLAVYASCGIVQCWIVNLLDEQVEVYSDPAPESATYRLRRVWLVGDLIPLEVDGRRLAEIRVADLLP